MNVLTPSDVSREGLKFYPWTFFSIFYQSTALSSHAVDGHQMHFGGSFVGKASTTGIEISPTPSLIFTGVGVKNCEIWCRFLHHSTLSRSRLKMQQDIRTLKQTSCVKMIALCPRQVWWSWVFAPRESYVSCAPPPKIAREKNVLNHQ